MRVLIIAAMSENRVIGAGNRLPWHLPDDLTHFKHLTQHTTMIMGRKTFDSLPGLLKGRPHWVISRQPAPEDLPVSVRWFNSLSQSLVVANELNLSQVAIIGGGEIYQQAMAHATDLHLTTVETALDGDTFFPAVSLDDDWCLVRDKGHGIDPRHRHSFIYRHYTKKTPPLPVRPLVSG